MSDAREAFSVYVRTLRTYVSWARVLLPLALVVFVPLGLVHALPIHANLDSIDPDQGVKLFALVTALLVLSGTGLVGEIFYTGTVSIALTHPHAGRPSTLREIAGMISYGRLVAVDLVFSALVAVGLIAFVAPGVAAYVYLGLAAPVAEIERRGVRASLARSFHLVRGHFWLVFAVLVPLELAGDSVTNLISDLSERLLGNSLWADWLADTASNVLLTPFFAIAAVILTLDLIVARDETPPNLHAAPVRA